MRQPVPRIGTGGREKPWGQPPEGIQTIDVRGLTWEFDVVADA